MDAAQGQEKTGAMGIALAKVEDVVNWGRAGSVWPLTFGLACCAIEQISAGMARFDIARFGSEVFRASPRQADLLIVSGRVSNKNGFKIGPLGPDPCDDFPFLTGC
jgi:NADH-quinone oxidoreductase subunit B